MKKLLLFYGLLAFALLMLFQMSRLWIISSELTTELIIIPVTIVSIITGIYFGRKPSPPAQEPNRGIDPQAVQASGISPRELEVLQLIAQGLSNKEIANRLFVSETTVKSHVSSLLLKLDAKRRTQAVSNAREKRIMV
ncbi:MAG TPA: helix-turn-helix transcriptional regulator [Cryomorphaceae bacterium]|nr:helix-turn-helix transcriptional regulator [Owenweeksia sp.]HAD96270.1 helix-turn-helix transcriptional regulator [Cryomorphaceae bacterium]HBF19697.1 helix-turn-helix transcriptional regulator [Cryomorphaceae bacterium]HCQ16542.1 helix-turn-helix transcriptional regulator [Cryomorphaceae bacterium]|tara:strand:- start:642 stop:1055 length:414 start_codon:yes stop_codon:yes gene_type:complete